MPVPKKQEELVNLSVDVKKIVAGDGNFSSRCACSFSWLVSLCQQPVLPDFS